ncbi:hypothetical protein [Rhizobium jaguaris]|uniref:hypothetical protein n=1 Tax=Rhizobium jaguaris TaxID=1312183 RepID=UPI0013C40A8C|nr:hypothetical protein [Rhizobium jaguaris]
MRERPFEHTCDISTPSIHRLRCSCRIGRQFFDGRHRPRAANSQIDQPAAEDDPAYGRNADRERNISQSKNTQIKTEVAKVTRLRRAADSSPIDWAIERIER